MIGFIIGLFVGACCGVLAMSLAAINKDNDDEGNT
jgi:hypothetical protein